MKRKSAYSIIIFTILSWFHTLVMASNSIPAPAYSTGLSLTGMPPGVSNDETEEDAKVIKGEKLSPGGDSKKKEKWAAKSGGITNELTEVHFDEATIYDRLGVSSFEFMDYYRGQPRLSHTDFVIRGKGGFNLPFRRIFRELSNKVDKPQGIPDAWWFEQPMIINFGAIYNFKYPDTCKFDTGAFTFRPIFVDGEGVSRVFFPRTLNNIEHQYLESVDRWRLTCGGDQGDMIVTSPSGVQYLFRKVNHDGDWIYPLVKIKDTYDNAFTFTYTTQNGNYLLHKVWQDNLVKIEFVYKNFEIWYTPHGESAPQLFTDNERILIDKVIAQGQQWVYDYTCADYREWQSTAWEVACGLIKEVNGPEGVKWKYLYNGTVQAYYDTIPFHLREVVMPYGGKVRYDWSSGIDRKVGLKRVYDEAGVRLARWVFEYTSEYGYPFDYVTVRYPDDREVKYTFCNSEIFGRYPNDPAKVYPNCGGNEGAVRKKQTYRHYNDFTPVEVVDYTWGEINYSPHYLQHWRFNPPDFVTYDWYTIEQTGASPQYQPILKKELTQRYEGENYSKTLETYTEFQNFDNYGNPGKMIEQSNGGSQRITDYQYQINDSLWLIRQKSHEKTHETFFHPGSSVNYNNKGKPSSITHYGHTTLFTYYATGDLHTVTDPRGKVTNFSDYKLGIAQMENHPEQIQISRVINDDGTIQSVTNGRGYTTSFIYDGLKRISSITTPRTDDGDIVFQRSFDQRYIKQQRGQYESVDYLDGIGRVVRHDEQDMQRSEIISISTHYDDMNRKKFISYPNSTTEGSEFRYDHFDRLSSSWKTNHSTVSYDYSLNDGQVKVRNERNFDTFYSYEIYGNPENQQLIQVDQPGAISTVITRTKRGDITSVTQAGITRNYQFGADYYVDYSTNPETGITDLSFDAAGNLISKKVGASALSTFVYDDVNRLKTVDYPVGTSDINYTYDKNGNITVLDNSATRWEYNYDANDNLKTETLTALGKTFVITYEYDELDNLEKIIYPSGTAVNYYPDKFGRPTRILGVADALTYHPNGMVKDIYFVNGVHTAISINDRRLPDSVNTANLVGLSYQYDPAGNTVSIVDSTNSSNTRTLTYDAINRLQTASGVWGVGNISYSADGDINSKNIGGINLSYHYNSSNNRLESISGSRSYSFQYDVYGNVVSNSIDTFSYNDASQLTSVTNQNIQYVYDGNNHRVFVQNAQNDKLTIYNKAGRLLLDSNMNADMHYNYIYLDGVLLARQQVCISPDTDADGADDCNELILGLNPNNPDTDGDGMQDGYEITNHLNPAVNDAYADADGDGLNNLAEYNNNTDPNDSDSDNDGIPDGYEVQNGLNPLAIDSGADPDGDGLSNLQEYQYGTLANRADSDGDGVNDADEIAAGTDPMFNLAAFIPVINLILD